MSVLAAQFAHRIIQPIQRQRIHPVIDQFLDDLGRLRITPLLFRNGVQPHRCRIGVGDPVEPDRARFLVEMLDRAAGMGDFIWAH